uniref:Uncharacterized protein n=1 Tax=Lepeophtheirus salmonis TaxID=72036 RepID=A0A0K2USG2_LEPSM
MNFWPRTTGPLRAQILTH